MIRAAVARDLWPIMDLAEAMHLESPRYRKYSFNADKVAKLILGAIASDEALLLVAEQDGEIIGMYAGMLSSHFFTDDVYATDLVLYMSPEHRGGSHAARMIKVFVTWAETKGVQEITPGVSTEFETERVRALYERLGFRTGGYLLIKDV